MKNWFSLFAVLLMLVCAKGQTLSLSGTVKDGAGQPIPNASIILMQADSAIVAFSSTATDGVFRVAVKDTSATTICASMLGFRRTCITIDETVRKTGSANFVLTQEEKVLQEVNVNARAAIRERGDTVVYRLEAFTNQTERNLEEALAKLPGFRVDDQGRISVNGKNISKINIEDDDLVGTDYQLLSKNLSAAVVEDVEVVGGYLENPLYKGILDSDEIALNLRLKDKGRKLLLGSVEAAGGVQGKYDITANGIVLAKVLKAYLLAKGNNAGFEVGVPRGNAGVNTAGDDIRLTEENTELLDIGVVATPLVNRQRTLFNNGRLGSLNAVSNPADKLSIRVNFQGYADGNRVTSHSLSRYFSQGDTTVFDEHAVYGNDPLQWSGGIDATYQITSASLLKIRYTGLHIEHDENTSIILNENAVFQGLQSGQDRHLVHADYSARIGTASIIQVQSAYLRNSLNQRLTVPTYAAVEANEGSFDYPMAQHYLSPFSGFALTTKWTSRLNNGFMYRAVLSYRYDQEDLESRLFEDDNPTARQAAFSNQYTRKTHRLGANVDGRLRLGPVQVYGDLGVHHDAAQLADRLNASSDFNQQAFYLAPNVGVQWSFWRRHRLSVNYTYNRQLAPLRNQYSGFIFTNYRNARNYETTPYMLTNQNVGLRYTYRFPYRQFFANVYLYHGVTNNALQSTILYDPIYLYSTAYPSRETLPFSGMRVGIDKMLSKLNLLTSLSSNVTRYRYINQVNSYTERQVNATTVSNELALNSSFNIPYNLVFRLRNSLQLNRTTVGKSEQRNNQSNWLVSLQNTWRLSNSMLVTQSLEYYRWVRSETDNNYQTLFLDFGAKWDVIKDRLAFTANVRNALNQQRLVVVHVSDYNNVRRDFALQPRMLLFGAAYRF
ncbi:carboxypeptidase regulatory-like domain-containing protein [Parapedobacter sp. ISTM3]|uniref:TonB-dependent receptor n=1 Tax=Parapedobacter sp. ISTM3 TaxID=2800130 RepID=UPI0019061FB2|nr:TonB-dependent receptor [Parapedobacter sp. ISTM3]MBK1439171.1 carboxypeptidase regulatory-like domain-containing protein [Parapedobacter sp. ISTM3]